MSAGPRVYICSRLEVDLGRRELRVDGAAATIGERAFDLLKALVLSAGELVSKDELIRRVWPGAIVEENTLEVHLSAVRKALGADRVLLKTAYGRGYRLLGTWTEKKAEASATTALAGTPSRPRRSNLPVASSSLIGRSAAVSLLCDLLSAHRAVTVTGIGGIGKTRLALEAAHRLSASVPGDVWFVDFASLADPALVPSAVARALDLRLVGAEHSAEAVARAMGDERLLLVLDNCEHLVHAVATLADAVLRLCQRVTVLATSREVLRVDGERTFRVPSLETPPARHADPEELLSCSAAELFVERMCAFGAAWSSTADEARDIAAICRQLDGIPLAIEFAASRSATLGIAEVAAGLRDRFALLTVGRRTALPQHRTLRAVLDWSYNLLTEEEAATLGQLAIFAGSFTLDAAASVAGEAQKSRVLECIGELVTKSLVVADSRRGAFTYSLLDTVRLYALEKLRASGQHGAVARRHAEYYRALAAQAAADRRVQSDTGWLAAYGAHLDNWRAALDWAFSAEGDAAIGVALTVGALPIWMILSLMTECRARVEQALAAASAEADPRAVMQLSAARAVALFYTEKGAGPEVAAAWTNVLVLADALQDSEYRLWARWGLWNHQLNQGLCRGALASAQHFCDLAEGPADLETGDRMVGVSLHFLGEQAAARAGLEAVLARRFDPPARSMMRTQYDQQLAARCYIPRILWLQGFPDQAMRSAQEVVLGALGSGHTLGLALALVQAGCPVALLTGDLAAADQLVTTLLDRATSHSLGFWHAEALCYAGILHVLRSDVAKGVKLFRTGVQELLDYHATMNVTGYLAAMASALADASEHAQAGAMVDQAFHLAERDGEGWCRPELLRLRGVLMPARATGEVAAAETQYRRALDLAHHQGALSWELRAATSLARLLQDQGRTEEARRLLGSVYGRFSEGFGTADLARARALLDMLAG